MARRIVGNSAQTSLLPGGDLGATGSRRGQPALRSSGRLSRASVWSAGGVARTC